MAFVRTGVIIVALLLGWVAVRSQPVAHVMAAAHNVAAQTALFHTAS